MLRSLDQDLFEQVQAKMEEPEFGKKLSERMWKMEGLFAEAKQNHCLSRAKYRGRSKVQIQAYLSAMVQNLKRLLFLLYCWLIAWWSCRPKKIRSIPEPILRQPDFFNTPVPLLGCLPALLRQTISQLSQIAHRHRLVEPQQTFRETGPLTEPVHKGRVSETNDGSCSSNRRPVMNNAVVTRPTLHKNDDCVISGTGGPSCPTLLILSAWLIMMVSDEPPPRHWESPR